MTAYILLGQGFEELEAIAVADILRRGNIDTKLVGISQGIIYGGHQIGIQPDMLVTAVSLTKEDCIIIPGGAGGVSSIENSTEAMELIAQGAQMGAKLSAICAGPRVLAQHSLLDGRKITCYPGCENMMQGAKEIDVSSACVVDGELITGRSPGTAVTFALEVLKQLSGDASAVEEGLYI